MNFCVKGDDRPLNQCGVFECKQRNSNGVLDPEGACCYTTKSLQVALPGFIQWLKHFEGTEKFFPASNNLFPSMLAFNIIEAT